jgi:hypothetical protein
MTTTLWSHWALTQYAQLNDGSFHAVAVDYGNGSVSPRFPDGLWNNPTLDDTGNVKDVWGLVKVQHLDCDAAETDPRVQPYHTVYDPITPETVAAYQEQGAQPGMMLCQLLALLARWCPAFRAAINQ